MSENIVIAGGGVIGLSVAWRAAAAGHRVRLVDPEPGRGASWLAGGMLAPVTEAWPGEEDTLDLGGESLRRWPGFAEDLAADAGDPGLSRAGTVVVAHDSADAEQLRVLGEYLLSLGRSAEPLTGRELGRLVPGLSVRSGLSVPGDLAVDNRKLLTTLLRAARRRGVEFVPHEVTEIRPGAVIAGTELRCDVVVIAAGARSGRLHPALAGLVRPLKGEILRLKPARGCLPLPGLTVRAVVEGRPIYLVPRADGEVVLGATQYEAGFDETVTAKGVRELLEGAERIFPSIAEYELTEIAAGLRAASVDTLPVLGELEPGVLAATGHHRNGLLLAPVTADAVLAMLDGTPLPEHVAAAAPGRAERCVN
ncbi:glycine oxidase ThiO [Amycolatopsis sp. CA-230715]|uniref:glycine oxidase ThiO n=1 Tax=Amycolatopsis sp. CA-230715 TaxID=2745196 RepID=UPI001C01120C|nr:glycine oxidase ThiO [Amycolatopsis sp. CA-230715]QWF81587.1 Hydrogen cyanide synthase subunit HcnC [Amycolatopsis sp. CA-230715]